MKLKQFFIITVLLLACLLSSCVNSKEKVEVLPAASEIHRAELLKSDFDILSEGQSLEDVRSLDPDGEYLFLFTGRNDLPRVSHHYTKDGYIIFIEYDESNSIISINERPV